MTGTGEYLQTVINQLQNQEIDRKSLFDLTKIQARKMQENNIFARAANLNLYKTPWQRAHIKPTQINRPEDLRRLPFIQEKDLVTKLQNKLPLGSNCPDIQSWFKAQGNHDSYWVPYTREDIINSWVLCQQFSRIIGVNNDDRIMVMSKAAPSISDALPYFLAYAYKINGYPQTEIIPVCIDLLAQKKEWVSFIKRRDISILMATPDDAFKLWAILNERSVNKSDSIASYSQSKDDKTDFTKWPIQRNQKPILGSLRLIVLYGPEVNSHWQKLAELYGVETIQTYGITNLGLLNSECRQGSGIHVMLDSCLPEIILDNHLELEKMKINYVPETVFLSEASQNCIGELVITTFGRAFPLIRYRTNQQIRLVSNDNCRCGCAYPRIELL